MDVPTNHPSDGQGAGTMARQEILGQRARDNSSQLLGMPHQSRIEELFAEHLGALFEREYPVTAPDGSRYRIDFADPRLKVGFELDGYAFHNTPEQFVADRQRQRKLEQMGWRIYRFAGKEFMDDPAAVALEAFELLTMPDEGL